MANTYKLSKKDIGAYQKAEQTLADLQYQFEKRLDYIIEKVVGKKISFVYTINNAASIYDNMDTERGEFYLDSYRVQIKKDFSIESLLAESDRDVLFIKDKEWYLPGSIPLRWFWEDFETELNEGLQQYKELVRDAAEQRKEAERKTKEELVKKAKNKLTKEEREALGL